MVATKWSKRSKGMSIKDSPKTARNQTVMVGVSSVKAACVTGPYAISLNRMPVAVDGRRHGLQSRSRIDGHYVSTIWMKPCKPSTSSNIWIRII